MSTPSVVSWIAFDGSRRIARGTPSEVASAVKAHSSSAERQTGEILVFDAQSSQPIEIDLRGSLEDVLARLALASDVHSAAASAATPPTSGEVVGERRGVGRPRLGVVSREVTLLPRHWDWLATQSGGASVALRKLVEQAMRVNAEKDRVRAARESAYRFMTAIAGNAPDHEEAVRALFADETPKLAALTRAWPEDVRDHLLALVAGEA